MDEKQAKLATFKTRREAQAYLDGIRGRNPRSLPHVAPYRTTHGQDDEGRWILVWVLRYFKKDRLTQRCDVRYMGQDGLLR